MKYTVTHTTKYAYSEAVPTCHNLVHLAPRQLMNQSSKRFRLLIHPEPSLISHRIDYFGNNVSCFSIDHAHRGLAVTATSHIEVTPSVYTVNTQTPPWEQVRDQLRSNRSEAVLDAYQYVAPSPSIVPFAGLKEYALPSFAPGRPILQAALDLTARINKEFKYDPWATTIQTPLREVLEKRHGVCQDFAHLQIGCLRAIGLAARYVSGYLRTIPPPNKPRLVGADASHAWLAVYCGEAGWIDVDPTNNLLVGTDHITVSWGRDYTDVCPIQGVIVGGGDHKMTVSVDVAPEETPAPPPPPAQGQSQQIGE